MKTLIEIEIEAANQTFYRTVDSASLEGMDQVWVHEDWVRCVHPGWDVLTGWKDVRESWDKIFQGEQRLKISTNDVSVRTLGEVALVTCIENITVSQGEAFDSVQTIATNIFIRLDGLWLMAHHHASTLPVIIPDSTADTIQ